MENVSEELNFDKIFKMMIFAMRINRCHPDVRRDRKWACHFLGMHGLCFSVFCLLIYSIIFYDIKSGNLTQACANGIIGIIFLVVTFKYCVMLRYQSILSDLMKEMKVDYKTSKSFSLPEQRIVHNYANRGRNIVNLWVTIAIVAGSLFVLKTFFLMSYYSIKGEFRLVPLYDLTYPSPIEEMKNEPAVYVFLFVIFLIYDGYSMTMYIAMAALGPVLMLHACGQLELVKVRILNIFKEENFEKRSLKKIKDVVRHLQKIYRFLQRVQKCFLILYELTLKATTIVLPISIYQIIQSYHNGDFRIEFITIIIGGITLSSVPCYYSDLLMDMGDNVRLAVYMCGWETHLHKHKELRATFLLIQLRTTRAMALRTLFRTICLDALTDVYHQSYAIFNVLTATPR